MWRSRTETKLSRSGSPSLRNLRNVCLFGLPCAPSKHPDFPNQAVAIYGCDDQPTADLGGQSPLLCALPDPPTLHRPACKQERPFQRAKALLRGHLFSRHTVTQSLVALGLTDHDGEQLLYLCLQRAKVRPPRQPPRRRAVFPCQRWAGWQKSWHAVFSKAEAGEVPCLSPCTLPRQPSPQQELWPQVNR